MKNALLAFAALTLLILIIDRLQKRFYKEIKWSRKVTHTLTGLIICTFPSYLQSIEIIVLAICFALLLGISKTLKILNLHDVNRQTWGEVFFPIGVGLTAYISLPEHPTAFYAGILCLSLADTAANVFGNILPIMPINLGKHKKSIGGFIGCYVTVLGILSVLYPPNTSTWMYIALAPFLISLTEVFSVYGTDNITVPTITTLLCLIY